MKKSSMVFPLSVCSSCKSAKLLVFVPEESIFEKQLSLWPDLSVYRCEKDVEEACGHGATSDSKGMG